MPLQMSQRRMMTFDRFEFNDTPLESALRQLDPAGFIYLWGEAGSGKSHLLNALINDLGDGAVYLSAATLPEPALLDMLQGRSLICVDDVHQLAGERGEETCLFNLYNQCRDSGAALVLASECSPRDSTWVLPDLKSRLNAGQAFQLQRLMGRPALQVMNRRAADLGLAFTDQVLEYIRVHSAGDLPSLLTLLARLDRLSLSQRRRVSVPLVKQALQIDVNLTGASNDGEESI